MQRKAFIPLDKGLNYRDPKFMVPESQFSAGLNARFGNGFVEKALGWKKFFADPFTAGISVMSRYFTSSGDSFLMIHTPDAVYKYAPGDAEPVDITGESLSGDINIPHSTETVQDFYVFSNNADSIRFWDGTGNSKNLPGACDGSSWSSLQAYEKNDSIKESNHNYICIVAGTSGASKPTFTTSSGATVSDSTVMWQEIGLSGLEQGGAGIDSCRFVVDYQGFLICGDTTEEGVRFPQRLRWPQWNNCVKWKNNADGSGQAGWMNLNGSDWLKNAMRLGSNLVVYKENSIVLLSYTGGTEIFQASAAIVGTGLIAQNAVVNVGTTHVFIGEDNIYSFNGMEPSKIGDAIKDEFFRLIDPGYVENICGYYNKQENEVTFAFTSINSTTNDMAIVLNTGTGAWGIRELPVSAFCKHKVIAGDQWDNDTETWDEDNTKWDDAKNTTNAPMHLGAGTDWYIYELNGYSKDGGEISFFVETGLTPLDEPTLLKRVKRIQMMVSRQGEYDLTIDVGTAANVDDEVSWKASKALRLTTTSNPWVDVDVTGRYFMIRLSNSGANQPVRITGMLVFFELRGAI